MNRDTVIPVSSEDDVDSYNVDAAEGEWSHRDRHWLNSIMADKYQPLVDTKGQRKSQIQSAYRMHVAEKNNKHMNPQVVSLGPCHHGKEELKKMERQKKIAARRFVLNSTVEVHTFYEKVAELLDKAKESYAPEIINRLSTQAFKRIMFLDGCFVAYFIIEKWNEGAIELEVGSRTFPLIVRDMFLFENQLPFAVLHALMKLRFNDSSRDIKFITRQTTLTKTSSILTGYQGGCAVSGVVSGFY